MAELGVIKNSRKCDLKISQTTTKMGGKPIWPSMPPNKNLILCLKCNLEKTFLIQLFAPVDDLHRQIFVFACLNKTCLNSFKTFTALSFATRNRDFVEGTETDGVKYGRFLKCVQISAIEEPDLEIKPEEYKRKLEESTNFNIDKKEVYEKPKSNKFINFLLAMEKFPKQFFRYHFDSKPLLVKKTKIVQKSCSKCQNLLKFEFQLMPFFFRTLEENKKFFNGNEIDLEWATVLFYTCPIDCVEDDYVTMRYVAQKAD